jgi:hypothetical protein
MRHAILVLAPLVACSAALAWAPESRVRIVDQSVRLMPESLRTALERHRRPLLEGMLEPAVEEDGRDHRPAATGGALESAAGRAQAELAEALARPTDFAEIARRLGRVAHWVADAGYPPAHGTDADAGRRYRHFGSFCDGRLDRVPLVFYGHDDLDRGFAPLLGDVVATAERNDRDLARAYAAAGDPPSPAAFDDRSVPFAICSLSYSQAVTNVVRAWLGAWKEADGDLRRTPYAGTARPHAGGEAR